MGAEGNARKDQDSADCSRMDRRVGELKATAVTPFSGSHCAMPGGGIAARAGVLRKWEACLRPEASDSAIMMATTEPPWLVTPEKVHAVVGRLIEMAHPKQIILFGSYARGKITENSDLDVLIVAGDEVENTRRESVRLRGALKEIEMPIDIVVVRESTFQKLSDTPGLIYEEARRTGLLVYECES